MKTREIDMAYLRECVRLDEKTGAILWNERPRGHFYTLEGAWLWNSVYADARADIKTSPDGYRIVSGYRFYMAAHRVVYALSRDRSHFPVIDHINGDKMDNRPLNLRACSVDENRANTIRYRASTGGRVLAVLGPRGNQVLLGEFETREDARKYRTQLANKALEQWAKA